MFFERQLTQPQEFILEVSITNTAIQQHNFQFKTAGQWHEFIKTITLNKLKKQTNLNLNNYKIVVTVLHTDLLLINQDILQSIVSRSVNRKIEVTVCLMPLSESEKENNNINIFVRGNNESELVMNILDIEFEPLIKQPTLNTVAERQFLVTPSNHSLNNPGNRLNNLYEDFLCDSCPCVIL